MITRMSHAPIFVNNQEEALKFYRDKLGFEWTATRLADDHPKVKTNLRI